jgi:Xaa-Pro aminopeptidase
VAPAGPGNVLTVEPGAYIRPAEGVPEAFWNIGVRIEDNARHPRRLRHHHHRHPKTVADIEALMREAPCQGMT